MYIYSSAIMYKCISYGFLSIKNTSKIVFIFFENVVGYFTHNDLSILAIRHIQDFILLLENCLKQVAIII